MILGALAATLAVFVVAWFATWFVEHGPWIALGTVAAVCFLVWWVREY
jgi:hypothetical protein